MKLSIVIPCYNESKTIQQILEAVQNVQVASKEVIVVDDGSTDGAREMLESNLRPLFDTLVCHTTNQGKGAAVRAGIAEAMGEIVIIQDADFGI